MAGSKADRVVEDPAGYLDTLQAQIPPPKKAAERGPAARVRAVERDLGIPLPPDLYEFARVYGTGWFGTAEYSGLVQIFNPFSAKFVETVTGDAETFRELKQAVGDDYIPYGIFPEQPGLLSLGYGQDRRDLFWLTEGEPKDWPILVRAPEHKFKRFDMHLAEFLVKLFNGEINCWGGSKPAKWFKQHGKEIAFTST
jgi:hypothetical protein